MLDILKGIQIDEMKAKGRYLIPMDIEDCPGEQKDADGNQEGSDDSLLPALQDDIYMQCLARTPRSYYASLSSVNRRFNSLLQSGYLYRLRRQLGNIEHWIYLERTFYVWEAFDLVRHRWMILPRMPSDNFFNYGAKESLAVGTDSLVFGKEISGFAIWRYSIFTHKWSRGSPMASPRCLFGSSSSGEVAIVSGGCDKNGVVLKSAELYNSELGSWEALPEMHFPRKLCSGFFMDGKFYVIGGMINNTKYLTCGEEFNLQTRTWRRIPNMFPAGNAHAPPLVVVNNELYALEHSQNEVKKYSKESNSWQVRERMRLSADTASGKGLGFRACGDRLLVIKGQIPEDEYGSSYLYLWQPGSAGRQPRWEAAVKKHAGGIVYNCAVMGC